MRNVTTSQNVFIYGHIDTVRYKFQIRDGGLRQLLWVSTIWSLWGLQKIPTLPHTWSDFAAIYYLVFVPVWIINIWMGDSRSKELFVLASFVNNIVFGTCIFSTFLAWYNLYLCWFGYLPLVCRNSGLPNFLAAAFSSYLLWYTLDVFSAYSMIIGRIRQSRSVKGISFPSERSENNMSTPYGNHVVDESSVQPRRSDQSWSPRY